MSNEDDDHPVAELPIDGELDLHAFRPEDVAELVHDYLDECVRRGIFEVRIVHGKGKGTLRRTVHAQLERRTDVLEVRLAPEERGGWGATLVTLVKHGSAVR
jgi:DNA-nicking Smr family endonuclease